LRHLLIKPLEDLFSRINANKKYGLEVLESLYHPRQVGKWHQEPNRYLMLTPTQLQSDSGQGQVVNGKITNLFVKQEIVELL